MNYMYAKFQEAWLNKMSPQVTVRQGILEGKLCKSHGGKEYYSFEGIPYAKPPVGKLRFREPQPPENWSGILDATKPGNKSAQINPFSGQGLEGSEDCLYLNVYTPKLPANQLDKLPVMVFAHGGRFMVGYADYYRPDYLLENDVIVVTFNYRLSLLGFLCLHIPEVAGNMGAKDSVMALRWVRDNIGQFNGDSNNVTVFGESAGGVIISAYITSKMTNGLYNKLIAQSSTPTSNMALSPLDDPVAKAKALEPHLGKKFNNVRELYEYLMELPVDELLIAANMLQMDNETYDIGTLFVLVVEKKFDGVERFLEEFPMDTLLKNEHQKVPMIIGTSTHEAGLFFFKDSDGNFIYENDIEKLFAKQMMTQKGTPKSVKIANKLRQLYFNGKTVDDSQRENFVNFLSDHYFNVDTYAFINLLARYSNDVYLYMYAYEGNMNTRVMKTVGVRGTTHGDMIPYLFFRQAKLKACTDEDLRVSRIVCQSWCNFARNGKPSWTNQNAEWLSFNPRDKRTLIINAKPELRPYPYHDRVKTWINFWDNKPKL